MDQLYRKENNRKNMYKNGFGILVPNTSPPIIGPQLVQRTKHHRNFGLPEPWNFLVFGLEDDFPEPFFHGGVRLHAWRCPYYRARFHGNIAIGIQRAFTGFPSAYVQLG